MRLFLLFLSICLLCAVASGQGTPPIDSAQLAQSQPPQTSDLPAQGAPPAAASSSMTHHMNMLIRRQINKAIDGKFYPSQENWRPLSTREKFDYFLVRTHSTSTFTAAAVDALKCSTIKINRAFEPGMGGFGQHYGVHLGVTETEVFFERFLVPSVLKQDPRYFRDPRLPFFKRALYSVSRVLITRADNGAQTFNASRIVGGAASQALADLYVPGLRQGMSPIINRVAFDLIRDAGFNLVHEFWPDLRRKFLHR